MSYSKKPVPEDFGYEGSNGPYEESGGWCIDGGEEAYYEALSKYNEQNGILDSEEALDPLPFTEEDLDNCWSHHKGHFIDVLNGDYSLDSAREDLRGLIGSEFDRRVGIKSN